MATIVNWRDAQPVISHDTAVVWALLMPKTAPPYPGNPKAPAAVLEDLDLVTVHGIQGRKNSDHHNHTQREQVYYVIAGQGEVLCGDTREPVGEGDAIYLPSGPYHQIFNQSENWILHHVISRNVDGDGGTFLKRNWRGTAPIGDGAGAMRWNLLAGEGAPTIGCLRGLTRIDRETVQPRSRCAERTERLEQIYYILQGSGELTLNGHTDPVREGDAIHVPLGATYHLTNGTGDWLTYLIIGG